MGAEARELVVALGVATFDGDGEAIAESGRLLVGGKDGEGEDAFCLVADVDEDGVRGEGHDGAAELAAGVCLVGVGALEVGEEVGEGLLGLGLVFSGGGHGVRPSCEGE